MNNNEEKFIIAKQLHSSGRIKEAQNIYLKLSKIYKKNHLLFYLLGTTFLQLKEYNKAIREFEISLRHNSNHPETYNNLGIALAEKKIYSEALINYGKAIEIKNDFIDAYLNRGISLNKLEKYQDAINNFKFVIKLQPENSKAYNNLGNVFKKLKNFSEAINSYDKAINLKNDYFEAISNKADVLHSQNRFEDSLTELNKIFKHDPNFLGLTQKIISNKMSIFNWENFDNLKNLMKKDLLNSKIFLDPLFIFYLFDDPKIQRINSKKFIECEFENYKKIKFQKNKKRNKNDKIKIGYFCGDFHNHPVLHIMTEIFKNHNKSDFEVVAFSHGPEKKNNIWKNSITKYFEKFYDVNNISDKEILRLANHEKIDIAVNLTGLTKYSRTGIFFNRVAPVQVSYLGYPGTSAIKEIDYIIADRNVIPENDQKFYSEKVCYLPKCYIPSSNDVLLKSSNQKFKRSEFNLAKDEIVFCAFHNPYKINPEIFNVWINILKKTKKSVLWIKTNNETARKNLKNEAKKRGLDPKRIIFAEGIENINDHIERLKLADIFLDSHPYNSHSTIYDYLRANLPMVIRNGNSFPSRVGASIYSSLNLSDLVAKNETEYENIAVELANNKSKLLKFKNHIKNQINNNYLFDGKKFTTDLEKLYREILIKI